MFLSEKAAHIWTGKSEEGHMLLRVQLNGVKWSFSDKNNDRKKPSTHVR